MFLKEFLEIGERQDAADRLGNNARSRWTRAFSVRKNHSSFKVSWLEL
jgi:hypothetical protein